MSFTAQQQNKPHKLDKDHAAAYVVHSPLITLFVFMAQ